MSKLSIQNIDLYYGDFKALKNINMEIEENKITAFCTVGVRADRIGSFGCRENFKRHGFFSFLFFERPHYTDTPG